MKIYHIPAAPPLYTNTFLLVGENGLAAAVDPAAGAQEYLRLLEEDGEEIRVDTDLAFRVIATPGHSAGSVCLLCGGLLFSGDTLFAGDVGRTDLPGGSWDTLRKSLKKLCAAVTENVQVLPGHEEFSTMDRERAKNRYLQF